jgi:hypothetical protein
MAASVRENDWRCADQAEPDVALIELPLPYLLNY